MPKFEVTDTFDRPELQHFVMAGAAVEGEIQPGMWVNVPCSEFMTLRAPILEVETVTRSGRMVVCLHVQTRLGRILREDEVEIRGKTIEITQNRIKPAGTFNLEDPYEFRVAVAGEFKCTDCGQSRKPATKPSVPFYGAMERLVEEVKASGWYVPAEQRDGTIDMVTCYCPECGKKRGLKASETAAHHSIPDQSINDGVQAALQIEDARQRLQALRQLCSRTPSEALDILISLLTSPEQKIRRRAGSALSFFKVGGVNLESRAEVLAEQLQYNPDERVRLSLAIHLMSVPAPAVDLAFIQALKDPFEKVAQIACLEVGDRDHPEGTAALFGMLTHPLWRVRLEACKALITKKTADHRVVTTLEAMSQESEAGTYDAEVDERKEFVEEFSKALSPDGTAGEPWGKFDTILAKARAVAAG